MITRDDIGKKLVSKKLSEATDAEILAAGIDKTKYSGDFMIGVAVAVPDIEKDEIIPVWENNRQAAMRENTKVKITEEAWTKIKDTAPELTKEVLETLSVIGVLLDLTKLTPTQNLAVQTYAAISKFHSDVDALPLPALEVFNTTNLSWPI